MNFLVLPLYKRADAMQEEERETELRLHKGVTDIKKTFKGDERTTMLQTFYRQNNYKPTYVLKGATSLFLEIPFFIAAYKFLSGLQLLNGVSFGPIADLGRPDGLLVIGGMHINLLPIIMDGDQPGVLRDFHEGKPAEDEDPAVFHGDLLPCVPVYFAGRPGILLDVKQHVLFGEDDFLQAEESGKGAFHPWFCGRNCAVCIRRILLSDADREAHGSLCRTGAAASGSDCCARTSQ